MKPSFSKKDRALLVERVLNAAKVTMKGRVSEVAKTCNVSHPTASGWIKGSLPRDPSVMPVFCDTYGMDIYEWITGTARGKTLQVEKLTRNVAAVAGFFAESNKAIDADAFAKLVMMAYAEEDKTQFLLDNLNSLNIFPALQN
tara:strand:- start:793 stop:1221 length:429 start_codon:yes stop_codon:yes gene_type:complete